MYGGDEVSAIVLDLGAHTCKAGYAGEDAPKAVLPSVVGSVDRNFLPEADKLLGGEIEMGKSGDGKAGNRTTEIAKGKLTKKLYAGVQAVGFRRDYMEVVPALKDGLIHDWDIVESIWDHTLRDRLMIDPTEHPMLLAEPSFNTVPHREKVSQAELESPLGFTEVAEYKKNRVKASPFRSRLMVELMFEKYGAPALFLVKNAVLTSFASGRATSLVVDCGGGSTTVAAVHDGYVLQKAIVRSPIGGDFLTTCMLKTLEGRGISVKPRYAFRRREVRPGEFEVTDLEVPHTTESYRLYTQRAIAADVKEVVCRVPDSPFEESSYANIPTTPYELPDGQIIEVGADRFKIPDLMFNPALVHVPAADLEIVGAANSATFLVFDSDCRKRIPGMETYAAEAGNSIRGLPHMVIESINKCDVDIRRELFSSILLAGGTAAMQQMKERLEKDLMEEAPQAARVKVLASGNAVERRFSVWIGGSILASLGSFQQMWLSKAEYEEHGPSYVHRKCP